jgi:hypothetical protein
MVVQVGGLVKAVVDTSENGQASLDCEVEAIYQWRGNFLYITEVCSTTSVSLCGR